MGHGVQSAAGVHPGGSIYPLGFSGPAWPLHWQHAILAHVPASTELTDFVLNPTQGMTIIPVNYGKAYASIVNMRISRTWGFGE